MRYAEIILPLPLYGTFTYSIDDTSPEQRGVEVGSRVLVQFGRKKHYTGIVERIHTEKPTDYEVRPIASVLDERPIVRYPQLKLWNWISDYYLCSPGEVYRAAVPAGLKPESETYVGINPDFEEDPANPLDARQLAVLETLQEKKRMRISELESASGVKGIHRMAGLMLERGMIAIDERVEESYRPKKKIMVRLTCGREDSHRLHEFFDMTARSRNQERALVAYLELSKWMNRGEDVRPVERGRLTETSGASAAVIKAMADKGIFEVYRQAVNRFAATGTGVLEPRLSPLSEAQERAYRKIVGSFREKNVTLLRGVTGSGKTEIYTHLMARVLESGSQILYLVPEISLTTQLTDRLRKVFGDRLLVYHSKFSDSERCDIWRRMLTTNDPLIVLGARSSVFLPFSRLGLVVVDEEHESSFKQYDPAPRYNARDAAILLASMHGAKTLLGSATPAVETYWKALAGKFGLVELEERFSGAVLPDVEIVDMKAQRKQKMNRGIVSLPMRRALEASLGTGRQAIMFQNRRGFAPVVVCHVCGWTPRCENCDVSLVYHKNTGMLRCHYCGFSRTLPEVCPACGEPHIDTFGYGTERIAEELGEQFPDWKVTRMDLDTTRNKDSYQEIIDGFSRHETDILVGTQMVTKGLDFGNVDTVGVLNADTLLNFPDFRSNERAFNMLEQVAGRAGRRKDKGRVIIQTTQTDSEVLTFVASHDYKGFYASEIKERERYAYPPFTKVITIYLRNKDARAVDEAAIAYTKALRGILGDRVLGPERPFVGRVSTWYLQSIMLKVETAVSMTKVKRLLRDTYIALSKTPAVKSSQLYFDVDPV